MLNPINIIIESVIYIINLYIIFKSKGRTKDLGIGLLLTRLSFLLFLIPILLKWRDSFFIYYFIGGLLVLALLLFLTKKNLIARNYLVITIGFLLFGGTTYWIVLFLLLYYFYKDFKSKSTK